MKELDELIFQKINNDPWLKYWLTHSGEQGGATPPTNAIPDPPGNAYGLKKMKHAHSKKKPEVPQLNFFKVQQVSGLLTGNHNRTVQAIYEFGAFAKDYFELTSRIRLLFDGWCPDALPASYEEVGGVSSVFDWEGGEGFDDELKENFRFVRIKFFVKIKPQVP